MFVARVNSKLRKELEKMGFPINGELNLVKVMDNDVYLFLLEDDEKSCVIKYYEKGGVTNIVEKYKFLENVGITVGKIIAFNDFVKIENNYGNNGVYRKICDDDLKDKNVIRKLAGFFKKFEVVCGENLENYIINLQHCFVLSQRLLFYLI